MKAATIFEAYTIAEAQAHYGLMTLIAPGTTYQHLRRSRQALAFEARLRKILADVDARAAIPGPCSANGGCYCEAGDE
jgi:hypothetical protein